MLPSLQVNGLSNTVVRRVTDGHKNPNGCNVPATWFVLESGSDCNLVRQGPWCEQLFRLFSSMVQRLPVCLCWVGV